ncbi:MAG TPA: MOSC N-terminal beta barrel domain-containing protein [Streptosporangiaceae bacterium]|jgi:hypothetical protein
MTAGTSPRLVSVHIYPLKSGRGIDLTGADVEPWGLAGDRRWLLVELDGKCVTQRPEPSMARIVVRYVPGGHGSIEVSADGGPPLTIQAPVHERGAELVWVTVWASKVLAAAAGPTADEWFSRFLGRPLRLVYLDDPTRRQVDPEFGHPDDRVSFADGFPLLLTTVSSLEALNDWLIEDRSEPVPMNRFRPSAVVAGPPAWAEDDWHRVRLGPVTFRVAKPCGRCQITTTDQFTGERGREPLMMLGRRRKFGQQLVFGQNLIPDGTGTIRVGDEVEILE